MKFQRNSSPIVEIPATTLQRLLASALESAIHETGGILVGFNDGVDIRVTDVSDAGPNAERSSTHFLRDTDYCREFLADHYKRNRADYVGEWHSHVVSLHRLSDGDLHTLAGIFIDPDYDFLSFAVVLVVMHSKEPELHVYVAERERLADGLTLRITELYRGSFPEESHATLL
jgi:integrative and conjugative element protein (TIGR02256 family)